MTFHRDRIRERLKLPLPASTNGADAQRWLAWPHWKADERKELAALIRTNSLKSVRDALHTGGDKPGAAPSALAVDSLAKERLALRRARRALDLLTLTGDSQAKKAREKWDALDKNPDAHGLQDLSRAIARLWTEQLPERYRQAKGHERIRISWLIHPFDLPLVPRIGAKEIFDDAPELAQQQKDFAAWIGRSRDRLDARAIEQVNDAGARFLAPHLYELAREQEK
jgi:hypothetical protein